VWLRTVEPRLTGASAWQACRRSVLPDSAVAIAQCAPIDEPPADCDEALASASVAARLIASQSACTDAAIAALETFSRRNPAAMSDLAAAYYVRAQRQDQPSDLLRAFDAAENAVAAAPRSPEARFNAALIAESLGLADEAIASWTEFLAIDHSQWADEARQHLDRLRRAPSVTAAAQWSRLRPQLSGKTPDQVARLIAPFQMTAEKYLEDELLPRWARKPSAQTLNDAKAIAAALTQLSGDRFPVDIVASTERSPIAMQKALLALAAAGGAASGFGNAAKSNEDAIEMLQAAGSPLVFEARYRLIKSISVGNNAGGRTLLDALEPQVRKAGYAHLEARLHALRAYCFGYESRYTNSLAESDAAIDEYKRLGDAESVADTRMRRVGVVGKAGQHELAWRDAYQALEQVDRFVAPQSRHIVFGEAASAAVAVSYPAVALHYQNAAIQMLRRELVAIPPDQLNAIKAMEVNLGTAFRVRAQIRLGLKDYDRARADLDETIRLGKRLQLDRAVRRTMLARREEVRGETLSRINPVRAVAAYTSALQLAGNEFLTYRAVLLARRAEAQRRAGRNEAADDDLRAAVAQLDIEQSRALHSRKRGQDEAIWSAYFSRFRETYQLLIRQLLDEGTRDLAFLYAEQARAREPLYLASETASQEPTSGTKDLSEIRRSLPNGTLLLEYSVLDDETVTWIVSRDYSEVIRQKATLNDVTRWSAELQKAVNSRSRAGFETQLYAIYDGLLAAPLAKFGSIPKRLVIVPDGPMHGLPFAALHNAQTGQYLIEQAPIEIAGSANLYLVSLSRDKALSSDAEHWVLLLGDPAFDSRLALAHGLHPLPRAKRECETIFDFYRPYAQSLLEGDATVPRFLELAKNSSIIHVAAHAVINAQAPYRSFILFAPSNNEAGPLEAQQLVARLLLAHTRLVVLATCSSAGGLPIGAEGVAPLVRPLIGAGVPAVVGTLWNVEDATAEEVLVSFHRHYREGSDAAVALQQAQVDLLRNKNNKTGLRSELAWAPFQVIGHSSSPFAPAPSNKEKPP
jgi:CHAT domain-containing protein